MERNSTVFLRSQWEGVHDLPEDRRLAAYEAIFGYAFDGTEPSLTGAEMAFVRQIMAVADSNNERYMNGKNGGAPKGNKNASKKQPKQPVVESETTSGCDQNNHNVYDVDVDVDVDVDDDVDILSGKPDQRFLFASQLIDYLNQQTGRNYKTTGNNQILVVSLLNKYDPEQIRGVIDKMVARWSEDERMSMYLRPRTLFAPSRFEEYLNADTPDTIKARKKAKQLEAEAKRSEAARERSEALRAELEAVRERLDADQHNGDLKTKRAWLEDEIKRLGGA